MVDLPRFASKVREFLLKAHRHTDDPELWAARDELTALCDDAVYQDSDPLSAETARAAAIAGSGEDAGEKSTQYSVRSTQQEQPARIVGSGEVVPQGGVLPEVRQSTGMARGTQDIPEAPRCAPHIRVIAPEPCRDDADVFLDNQRCYLLRKVWLKCTGCGETLPMAGGDFDFAHDVMAAFARAHRGCEFFAKGVSG